MFSCNLPPALWQNDRDLLRATAVTRGWNGYRNESAQKVDPGEDNSPAAPVQRCFTSTMSVRTVSDGEPRTAASTSTQLLYNVAVRPQRQYELLA